VPEMPQTSVLEETIEFPPFDGVEKAVSTRRRKRRGIYQALLILQDLAVVQFVFLLVASAARSTFLGTSALAAVFAVSGLTSLSFFNTYRLFSHHHIFLKKDHFVRLGKALFWGFAPLCLLAFLFMDPDRFVKYILAGGLLLGLGLLALGRRTKDHSLNLFKAAGVACLLIGCVQFYHPYGYTVFQENPRLMLTAYWVTASALILSRFLLVQLVYGRMMRRRFRRQLLIIGSNGEARRVASHLVCNDAPYWVSGVVGSCAVDAGVTKPCLGAIDVLPRIVAENPTDEIVVTDEAMDKKTLISVLDFCTSEGLTVWFPPSLLPIIGIKLVLETFCGLEMIRIQPRDGTWISNKAKHAFDALTALPLLLLLAPVFGVIAAAIKLNSKGPVFYRARAVGKGGRIFSMLKFRSMVVNNRSDIHQKYVTDLIEGRIKDGDGKTPLKIVNDPRVTAVGRILRKLSLDELPQLINVLKGDMSLVGPRPCLPYEYEIYKDWHKKRTAVRPGITGLWQVAGRSEVQFEDMILLDLYYVYNRSLLMDLMVLYETVFVVLKRKGAY